MFVDLSCATEGGKDDQAQLWYELQRRRRHTLMPREVEHELANFTAAINTSKTAELKTPLRSSPDQSMQAIPILLDMDSKVEDSIVTINISGKVYQTYESTLARYPGTLLGNPLRRAKYFNLKTNEYFFDRHRASFEAILYWYQSCGCLRRPSAVPVDTFLDELKFFDVDDDIIESFWEVEGYIKPKEPDLPANRFQRAVWLLFEYPDSSFCARIVAFFSVSVIALSVITLCLETMEQFKAPLHVQVELDAHSAGNNTTRMSMIDAKLMDPFYVIEVFCITWFCLEFVVRALSCPSKIVFFKSFLNCVDMIAILPFFIDFVRHSAGTSSMSLAVLRVLRLVRVFRIFKLSRHSRGLQILGMTFRASVHEFCLLVFFLGITVILFASATYYAEHETVDSKFKSIPHSFWYVIVTMTTIGYGDLVPTTGWGKLLGSITAITGVLVIALPVPVIVENFKNFYRRENRIAYLTQLADSSEPLVTANSDLELDSQEQPRRKFTQRVPPIMDNTISLSSLS